MTIDRYTLYSSPTLSMEEMFQDPWWMSETAVSTEPLYILCFFYTYAPVIKFNLSIRHNKRLTTTTNNEIEQL